MCLDDEGLENKVCATIKNEASQMQALNSILVPYDMVDVGQWQRDDSEPKDVPIVGT